MALTIHVQPLDDNFQLHLVGHVAQGAHGRAQLLLGDEAIAIAVKDFEGLTDLCGGSRAGWDLTSVPNTPLPRPPGSPIPQPEPSI